VAFNNLGAIYAGQKKFDSAQTCFEKAYKLDTTQSLSITNLMVVYINTGQFDKVIYYGEKANQMGIDEPKIKDLLLKARQLKSQN
jgi:Tfp pilus assembly protein PilF